MINTAGLLRAITDGIMARRKLNGDLDIIGPSSKDELEALIQQGKRAEERALRMGMTEEVDYARRKGEGES